jgi:GNAT superfamily N-acetyltransferase
MEESYPLLRPCKDSDFDALLSIINDGATAYRGIIPEDRWTTPYMSADKLRYELHTGISFSCVESGGGLVGAMGSQQVDDALLIRHAYVLTACQRHGFGSELLVGLVEHAPWPVLIGTWKAAHWAIRFYEKHNFNLIEGDEKDRLLDRYWRIPARQVETSVVMADPRALREIVRMPSQLPEEDDVFKSI